jgi:hypothetical protein
MTSVADPDPLASFLDFFGRIGRVGPDPVFSEYCVYIEIIGGHRYRRQ